MSNAPDAHGLPDWIDLDELTFPLTPKDVGELLDLIPPWYASENILPRQAVARVSELGGDWPRRPGALPLRRPFPLTYAVRRPL